jgi:hypothetical protein
MGAWNGKTLSTKLRAARPAYLMVHVTDADEPPTKITCPDIRAWRNRVLQTLADLAWERVELYDKKGGLLAKHDRGPEDEPATGDLESLPAPRSSDAGVVATNAYLQLMLKAQDLALTRHMAVLGPMFDTLFKILDVSMRRLELHEKQYEHALKINATLSQDLARAGKLASRTVELSGGEESESGALVEALLPAILQAATSSRDHQDDEPRERNSKRRSTPPPERQG